MQVLQDKWKSFRANRKLQGLWNDFQHVKDENMSERKEQRLNAFLECLNNIAEDQISQDQIEEKKNAQSQQTQKSTIGLKRNIISGIFQDIPQVINAIMEYLDENGFNIYTGSKYPPQQQLAIINQNQQQQMRQNQNNRNNNEDDDEDDYSPEKQSNKQQRAQLVNIHILKTIQIIFKDYEQPIDQDIIIVLYKAIVRNIDTVRDEGTLKQILQLIQRENKNQEYKTEFVKSKGYQQLIQMLTQNCNSTQSALTDQSKGLIMRFVRKSLQRQDRASEIEQLTEGNKSLRGNDIKSIFQAITNEIAEYFINPDYLFHDKAFDEQQMSPNSSMLDFPPADNNNSSRMRRSQGSFLRKGYDEEDINQMLQMQNRLSDAGHRNSSISSAYPPTKNMLEGLMLQQEFSANRASAISQRSSKLDQLTEHDKLSLQLREDKLQETFIDCIKSANDSDLPCLIEILGLLINYSLYNERDFERKGGYSILQQRLQNCQERVNTGSLVNIGDKRKAVNVQASNQETIRIMDAIFEQLLMVICPMKSRIKTYNALKLLLNLIEQSENLTIQIQSLSTLKIILEKELENCVIFHKANGYKYFENSITVIALIHKNSKLPILRQILEISSYIIFVLGDLDVMPMVEFLSGLIQTDKQNITNEIYEELTNFINSVVSDKIYRLIHKKKKYSQYLILENQQTINILGQVFLNGYSLLKQSIDNLKTKDRSMMTYHDHFFFDQSIKLLIKIADYQIKVYSQSLKSQHSLIAVRDSESRTVLDKLLENSENIDIFIQKLLNNGLSDNFKFLKILQLISQLLIIQQPLFHNSDVAILKIMDFISNSSYSQFYQVFLTMLFGRDKNPYVKRLVESIEQNNALISKLQDQLIANLPQENQSDKLIKDLHFLTLLTRYSKQNQDQYEKTLDIFVFLKSLNLNNYMQDQQLFILQFLLELQGQNPLYERAIDSPDTFIEANINQILSNQYVEFVREMKEELKILNLKFNTNIHEMDQRESRLESFNESQIMRKNGLLRGPNESLTMFLLTLIQAKPKVQIQIFQDLISLMSNQSENRKTITDLEALEFILKVFDMGNSGPKSTENQAYTKTLSDFIYQLLLNVKLSDPTLLLKSLKDKGTEQINSYHLQNVIQALQVEYPMQHIQIQQDENQSLEDNIDLFPELEFQDKIVFNGWFHPMDLKLNQNLLFQIRSERTYMKIIYERTSTILPSNFSQSSNSSATQSVIHNSYHDSAHSFLSDTNDNLIILLNDFYKRIPIDVSSVSSNQLCFFQLTDFNNIHIQLQTTNSTQSKSNFDSSPLIMINGVNLTEQFRSKLKFDNGPFKVHFPQSLIRMTQVRAFDQLLNEKQVIEIYNNGLLEELPSDQSFPKPQTEIPERLQEENNNMANGQFQYQKVTKIHMNQAVANKGWSLRVIIPLNYEHLDVFLVEDRHSQMSFQDYEKIPGSLLFRKQPLKQYLCNEESLKAALDLISSSSDEKQLYQSFTFLSSLIIRNNHRIIDLFSQIDGFEQLRSLILKQQSEKLNIEFTLQALFDISCNQHNTSLLLQKQPLMQSNILRLQPRFDSTRMDFLKVALRLLPQVKDQHMVKIVNSIYQLLTHGFKQQQGGSGNQNTASTNLASAGSINTFSVQQLNQDEESKNNQSQNTRRNRSFDNNMVVFRGCVGIQTVLRLFQLLSSDTKFMHIYEQVMQIYELYIAAIKNEVFEEVECVADLKVFFDFFAQQGYKNQRISQLAMDCLSIIAIHIVVDESSTSLVDKILQIDIFNSLMTLMRVENPDVKEYAVKFMSLLLFKSSKFRVEFKSRQGFKFMDECLNHNGQTSRNLIKTIIEASTDQFDNANALYPSTSSIVHTLMNDSEIALIIVDHLNKNLHKPKKTIILHFEMFQSIFNAISLLESEQTSANMLKEIRTLIKENIQQVDNNGQSNIMNLHREHFSEFLDFLFEFLQLKEYRLEQVNYSLLFSETQTNTDNSSSDGGYIHITEQKVISKRSIELTLEILTFIIIYDLQQQSEQSQTLKYLESWVGQDAFKQLLILTRLLKHFEINPKIQAKEMHTLTNIKKLIDELDNLLEENVYVNLKFMQLINSFAFKNTMDIRKSMKQLQLFEIRDDLMINIIRYCGDTFINCPLPTLDSMVKPSANKAMFELIQTATTHKKSQGLSHLEQLLKLVSSFSFETVASKQKFRDSYCIESISYFMLNSYLQSTRDSFRHILKDQVMQYEDNHAYIKAQLPELVGLVQFKEYGEGQMKGFVQTVTSRLKEDGKVRETQREQRKQQREAKRVSIREAQQIDRKQYDFIQQLMRDQLSQFVTQARQNLRENKITQVISGALNYGIIIV